MKDVRGVIRVSTTALITLVAVTALLPWPASGEVLPPVDVVAREQDDGTVGLIVRMPQEARLTDESLSRIQVTVGGNPVGAEVVTAQGVVENDRVLLLVDASGSMQGVRLRQVRQAVQEVLASLDPTSLVGLGTFADEFGYLVPATTDRQAITAALASVRGDGDTALFDALATIIEDEAAERIVVLTDGEDTASSTDAADVINSLSQSRIPIDVIALQALGDSAGSLAGIVEASGGSGVVTATDVAMSLRESVVASDIELRVGTAVLWNQDLDGQQILVSVTDSIGQTFSGGTSVDLRATATTQTEQRIVSDPPWWTLALLALLSFAAVTIGALAAVRLAQIRKSRKGTQRVMAHYSSSGVGMHEATKEADEPSSLTLGFLPRTWIDSVRTQVENAGLPLTPAAWLLVHATVAVVVLGLLLLADLPIIIAIIGMVVSVVLIQAVVRSRIESARRQFNAELADFFTLVASGLRSGLSLAQAVAGAAQGGGDVLARQMRRVTAEVALGMDLADALEGVAIRMSSDDLTLAVQAVRIQRESGGSLSNILDIAATTVRQRGQLQREVRALSAEGRISAIILMILPLLVFGFFLITRREYVEVFWTEPIGWVMLGALVVILGIGGIWMQRMTRIDI